MINSRRWQISILITLALVGIGFGIWLFRLGFITLGCVYVGVFLWRGQQFSVWFIAPAKAPPDVTPPLTSIGQRLLLSIVWHLWPEEWQAGFVFVLFGLLVLAPVTIKQIQSRRKVLA
jgi:hypothetical protein